MIVIHLLRAFSKYVIGFADCDRISSTYSYLSAWIGSWSAALRAG